MRLILLTLHLIVNSLYFSYLSNYQVIYQAYFNEKNLRGWENEVKQSKTRIFALYQTFFNSIKIKNLWSKTAALSLSDKCC